MKLCARRWTFNEQATYVALLSNVVNTVIASAGYRDEISATRELIDLQRRQLKLAEVQVSAGTAAYSTVLSLRSQLASYEATIPELEQRLSQSNHLLATLVGHLPAEWGPPPITLGDLTLPADLPVSLPSEMVRQRPDILMAEASAHQASAQVGVATAALFPSIALSGNYSANGTSTALVQTNYEAGLSTYLEVLTADTQYHQAKINDLQMVAQGNQDTVALCVALGGGWWNGVATASQENRP